MLSHVPFEDTLAFIMSKRVYTATTNQNLKTALESMVKNDVGAIVILDSGELVGMVTERDVTKHVLQDCATLERPLSEAMAKPLVTAGPETRVTDAFEVMLRNKIRRLPIVDDGKLVGIVTEKDLMRWVLRVSYEPIVPEHIKALLA